MGVGSRSMVAPLSFPKSSSSCSSSLHAFTQSLQIYTPGPAISLDAWFSRLPQKLQRMGGSFDLAMCLYAQPDFVTLDGRGGATGSSPLLLRDSASVPTIYALHRARCFLDEQGSDVQLVITGGLRVSADIAKALAMGADAVALATAPLMAMACRQYRICGSGGCPMGIATQDPALRARLKTEHGAKRVENFFRVTKEELRTFARIIGKRDIHDLSLEDLCTVNRDMAEFAGIPHA